MYSHPGIPNTKEHKSILHARPHGARTFILIDEPLHLFVQLIMLQHGDTYFYIKALLSAPVDSLQRVPAKGDV